MKAVVVGLVLVALCIAAVAAGSHGSGRGFGEQYDWYNDLESGLVAAKNENKPVLLLIHKTWCGACKRLKPEFASSTELLAASKDFIMVNLEDDEEPKDERYKISGGYIPRIYFLYTDGNEIKGPRGANAQYPHFYSSFSEVIQAMSSALQVWKQ